MMNSALHDRIARIARDILKERFTSIEDQADAMAAAIITELAPDDESEFLARFWVAYWEGRSLGVGRAAPSR
jgi:hypothetical protein